MKQKDNHFIMLPTVDFCFKELMNNPIIRKGFVAALLHTKPEEIGDTQLLPTELRRSLEEEKLGILDVRIKMKDGSQMDMEMQVNYFEYWDERVIFYITKMFSEQLQKGESYEKLKKCIHVSILDFVHFHEDEECYRVIHLRDDKTGEIYSDKLELQILELKKLPKEITSNDGITGWMRFFSGKCREEFEVMAKTNEYLGEAYNTLLHLSEDEEKRLEYEAREKALKDYNTQMQSTLKRGEQLGERRGELRGVEKGKREQLIEQVKKKLLKGKTAEEISEALEEPVERIEDILRELKGTAV